MRGLVCFSNLFSDSSGEFQDISNKTLYVQPNLAYGFKGGNFNPLAKVFLIDDFHPRTPLTFPFLSFFVVVEAHRAI